MNDGSKYPNLLVCLGVLLTSIILVKNSFFRPIPETAAIVFYSIGAILIIAGLVLARRGEPRE